MSVSAGSGHVRAAEAVKKTAELNHPDLEVQHIDLMDYISLPMKKAVVGSYDLLVRQAPELWGYIYEKTNNPKITKKLKKLNKKLKKINAYKFNEYVSEYNPDYILYTNFLPTDMLDNTSMGEARIGTLVTDYDLHELWVSHKSQDYFVATEKIAWKLEYRGFDRKNITVSGIPIDPKFYKQINTPAYNAEVKEILVLSGGQGLAHSDNVVRTLFKLTKDVKVTVIAGKNKALQKKLEKLEAPENIEYSVIGWTDRIEEYMASADVIISKPGGLTTTECAVLGKWLIAVDPIPGQEEGNAQFLLERGIGDVAHNTEDLLYYVSSTKGRKHSKPLQEKSASEIILEKIKNPD